MAGLRAQAKSTIGQNGTPIPGLWPSLNDSAIDRHHRIHGSHWRSMGQVVLPRRRRVVGPHGAQKFAQCVRESKRQKLGGSAVHKAADTAGPQPPRRAQATTQCESADTAGKALENWQFERGKRTLRVPNNEASRKKFCEVILAVEQSMNDGWVQRKTALA